MDLPFQSQQETAPGFRPQCKISAAGNDGLGGGLLDVASSLLGAPQDDPWANHLRRVELILAPAPFLSIARLQLANGEEGPEVAIDDELKIELGYDDSLQTAFTGKVLMLGDRDLDTQEILLGCGGHALAQMRQYTSFENQSLADILNLWASDAALSTGNIDTGPSYPFLAIDDQRSLWEWSAWLARHAGAWVWTGADNNLNCKQPGEPSNRSYTYGSDLLGLDFSQRTSLFGEVNVSSEGSAGSQGKQAWSWLTKSSDAVSASAGQGSASRLYQDGSLRNQEAVQSYARSVNESAERQRTVVKVRVPGSPELSLGQTFDITDCPNGRGDGSYIITRLHHLFDNRGFTSELSGVAA